MKRNKLELQSLETSRKILEAADRLFFSQGYAETSVDDICREAGVTKGAFYHHFKNKDAVYSRCYIPRLDRYLAEHYSVDENASSSERFLALARCTFLSSLVCGRELTAQSIIGMLSDRESRLFDDDRMHTRLLNAACDAALAEGLFPGGTTRETVIMLYALMMNGFLVKWASASEADNARINWEQLLAMEMTLLTGKRG